ncbi:glycoside/pentoside/hexuronide:cation symporter, GPH family [Chitinophaga terrae (ex Kim and Jung 2007)]|uniref:Glycoside/pentoside/hexuronide:cation symporter, GPH family n=1 Tax=Chitinophaga terrae (ex Kim and Jung 2007) TaxID=408074 RepID=A0A1H3X9Z8_9BACT|nr:MFS transporter [Chitinophaga terrae (ex Kim and Jung 2007)]GEP89836.1 MFS transporter [Chitinophaga terrae (ex Kim and Jung 2007)]SDZ96179.1 glycoside/pentoside/hexuronide:cation symporter, GPH family [Chitinophaga terrae (ex Kim and Jung 2007)]
MRISLKEKVGYGLGDMASSMFWKLFGTYLLFFYTDIMGLAASAVGTLFLVTRIWDTLFDPVVGVLADRTTSRYGRFRPYLLYLAIPFGLTGILTFTVPSLGPQASLVYAYITYSLMMMVYSLINVPYASLLGVISDDARERNTLAAFRMAFAFIGSLVALALIEPLVHYFSGRSTEVAGWQRAVSAIALICVILFLTCFSWVKERVVPTPGVKPALKDDLKDLLANRPWWILLGAGIAALVFNSVRDGATIYYFKYFVGQSIAFETGNIHISWSTLYLITGQAANIIGVILAAAVGNKWGKKTIYLLAMLGAGLLSIFFYWLDKQQLMLIFVFQFLISVCAGIIFPLLWSMYADIADYSEWKNGRRATGLIFSSSSMSQKFGWTIGGALTGWLLGAFGFKANEAQEPGAMQGIVYMMSFLPAAGAFISALLIAVYPLSENKIHTITSELQANRK